MLWHTLVLEGHFGFCLTRTPREIDLLLKDDKVHKPLPFRESVLVAARTERGAILDETLSSAARQFKFRTAHDLALAYHSLVGGRSVYAGCWFDANN